MTTTGVPSVRPTFHLELPATPLATRTARRAARAFAARAGITGRRLDEVEIAVAEACANAVVHGIPDRVGTFELSGCVCGDSIVVRATDWGTGIGGSQTPGGLGLGIPLITGLSDDVQYAVPASGGTQVCMTFFVRPADRPPRGTEA